MTLQQLATRSDASGEKNWSHSRRREKKTIIRKVEYISQNDLSAVKFQPFKSFGVKCQCMHRAGLVQHGDNVGFFSRRRGQPRHSPSPHSQYSRSATPSHPRHIFCPSENLTAVVPTCPETGGLWDLRFLITTGLSL